VVQDFWKGANSRQQYLGWRFTPTRESGASPSPGKFLKIGVKILQFRDIFTTYYTTLKIRYSSYVNGKVIEGSDSHIIITYTIKNSRAGIQGVYS